MPFVPTPIPPSVTRNVVIQLKGPKDEALIKRLNYELKKVARKYGARFKSRPKSTRRKAKRAKARRK
jgi:hypothetical protein